MQKYVIDRFEGDFAVCEMENGDFINILKTELPENIKESDVLIKTENGFEISETETQTDKERIKSKLSGLFNRK